MRALVLTSPGAFEVREVPVPKPGPHEVLCRIRGVAICGSDPEIIRGGLAGTWPPSYPFIPGHEWSGEVVEAGDGVLGFKPGDRVAGEAHKGCGYCRNCLQGRYNLCENYGRPETGHRHYGFVSQGAYAQYNVYSIRSINHLPQAVSFREGALVDTAGVTLHGMELTGITPGGTVAVIGPGPDRPHRGTVREGAGRGAGHRGRTRRTPQSRGREGRRCGGRLREAGAGQGSARSGRRARRR